MTLFGPLFLSTLVYLALGLSVVGVVILLALLWRDFRSDDLW